MVAPLFASPCRFSRVFGFAVLGALGSAAVLCAAAVQAAEQPSGDAPKTLDEQRIVIDGVTAFREAMQSADEKTRQAAFDAIMPDEALLRRLLGDDARLIWPILEKGLAEMRSDTRRFGDEFAAHGAIQKVEAIDVRRNDVSGRYRKVLGRIPADIPVYRVIVTYEKGPAGSSSYLVVDGKLRFVRGLEGMPEFIEQQKSNP